MQKQFRLQKNKQFQYVYRQGKSSASHHLILLHARNRQLKVGFSVSKKVGNAVVRNRVKRQLREIVRPLTGQLKPGYYVIIARNSAPNASFDRLSTDLEYLIRKQNLYISPASQADELLK